MKGDPTSSPPVGARRGPEGAEADLVRRAKDGDREAFGRLVERHQGAVMTTAHHFARNPEDAADIAQEAFLRAWRSLAGFSGQSTFRTWLLTITANAARSEAARRGAKKRSAREVRIHEPHEGAGMDVPEPDGRGSPEAHALRREAKEAIEAAIAALDDDSRQAVVLRDLAGESYEAIAAALGLPLGTVKSRIHRARLELRGRLRKIL